MAMPAMAPLLNLDLEGVFTLGSAVGDCEVVVDDVDVMLDKDEEEDFVNESVVCVGSRSTFAVNPETSPQP
jgi:hypothetical protein